MDRGFSDGVWPLPPLSLGTDVDKSLLSVKCPLDRIRRALTTHFDSQIRFSPSGKVSVQFLS